jgi:hypothetical protein
MESMSKRRGKRNPTRKVISLGTPLFRFLLQAARIALAVLLLILASKVEGGEITTDDAIAMAGLAAGALLLLSLSPRVVGSWSQRISKISIGPIALEVFKVAEEVAPATPTEDADGREPVTSVLDLRLKIERKLTYLAKHVLDENGSPTFLTVGSLKWDGLLPAEEADLINRLMTLRDEDLRELPPAEQDEFLKAADRIARSMRASVLNCLVWKRLRGLEEEDTEWAFEELARGEGKRPDVKAERKGRSYLIVPVFATSKKSALLDEAKARLRREVDKDGDCLGRIIVLPHHSKSPKDPDGFSAIITTDDLLVVLMSQEKDAER